MWLEWIVGRIGKGYGLWLLGLFLVSACEAQYMDVYQESQIEQFTVERADGEILILTITPILETAYFCSGVKAVESDDQIKVSVVRCRLNAECSVDAVAMPDPLNAGSYKVTLPDKGKLIKLIFGAEASLMRP